MTNHLNRKHLGERTNHGPPISTGNMDPPPPPPPIYFNLPSHSAQIEISYINNVINYLISKYLTYFVLTGLHIVQFQKISIPLPLKVFWFESPTLWKFQLSPTLSFKILAFETPTPLEFPMTFHGVRGYMDIFWNNTILCL